MTMRRANRIDGNHAEIREGLRKCGIVVADTSSVGNGHPDLLCGNPRTRRLVLLEVKMPGNKHTWMEEEFAKKWRAFPVHTVTSIDEALCAVGEVQKVAEKVVHTTKEE